MSTRRRVLLYTDGACSPNPGLGGWGAVLISPEQGQRKTLSGAEPDTTNNRMELLAAIRGLEALKFPCRVELTTDSQYLCQAFKAGWLTKWKANGWKTSAKEPVKNEDLWRALDQLTELHDVEWHWVKGHAAHPENEEADRLAVAARERLRDG
ncbi:MAG: ribonuclease HI [Myxococcales bacterium]|nr:ribonuclease HI [Myxococcales bacterium]